MLKVLRWGLVWLWFALATSLLILFFIFRPKNPMNAYITTHLIGKVACKILGIQIFLEDKEKLYQSFPCVYIANHQSATDIFAFGSIFPKKTFVVGKKSLKFVPFFGWIFTLTRNVYIDRKDPQGAIHQLNQAADVIKSEERSLFLFPEGTRSKGKGLGPLKKGAFRVAQRAGVAVVPIVAKNYDYDCNKWRAGSIHIKVLDPINVEGGNLDRIIESTRNQFLKYQMS